MVGIGGDYHGARWQYVRVVGGTGAGQTAAFLYRFDGGSPTGELIITTAGVPEAAAGLTYLTRLEATAGGELLSQVHGVPEAAC